MSQTPAVCWPPTKTRSRPFRFVAWSAKIWPPPLANVSGVLERSPSRQIVTVPELSPRTMSPRSVRATIVLPAGPVARSGIGMPADFTTADRVSTESSSESAATLSWPAMFGVMFRMSSATSAICLPWADRVAASARPPASRAPAAMTQARTPATTAIANLLRILRIVSCCRVASTAACSRLSSMNSRSRSDSRGVPSPSDHVCQSSASAGRSASDERPLSSHSCVAMWMRRPISSEADASSTHPLSRSQCLSRASCAMASWPSRRTRRRAASNLSAMPRSSSSTASTGIRRRRICVPSTRTRDSIRRCTRGRCSSSIAP